MNLTFAEAKDKLLKRRVRIEQSQNFQDIVEITIVNIKEEGDHSHRLILTGSNGVEVIVGRKAKIIVLKAS